MRDMRGNGARARLIGAVALSAVALGVAACGGDDGGGGGGGGGGSSAAASKLPTTIGKGEGQLNLIAWEGYTQPQWVKPFEAQTGCQVNAKYAGSSDEMVTLMRQGGGWQYDMVSASGDASAAPDPRRRRAAGERRPRPRLEELHPAAAVARRTTRSTASTTASRCSGARTCCCTTPTTSAAPTSWSAIYDPKYSGKITVPDNPIQIADAALYLSKTQPSLGITDPYELTRSAARRGGGPAQAAAPADQEVLGAGLGRDRRCSRTATPSSAPPGRTRRARCKDAKAPGRRHDPERGRDGLGRHVDALRERAAPQLRVPVAEVDLEPEGPGPAGALLRRDAGQHEGLRDHGPDRRRARARSTTPTRPRRTSTRSVLEDAGRATAATARRTAWTTRRGSRSGQKITG